MSREVGWRDQLFSAARELAPAEDKGRIYAAHFANFLRELMGQGVISDWRETKRNSRYDRKGVDFWVVVGREKFGFQTTSTEEKAKLREEKHPDVYALWLKLDGELRPDEELKRQLLKGMRWYRDRAAKGRVMFGYRSGELSM